MPIANHFENYHEVINHLSRQKDDTNKGTPRPLHLLLGNGFSINYSHEIFTYKALAEYISKNGSELVKNLFLSFKTENFELIMEQLDQMIAVLQTIPGLEESSKNLAFAKEGLKTALIDAIRKSHPDHVFKVTDDEIKHCSNFLKTYIQTSGKIFTTNYDLLLYWVINRGLNEDKRPSDGFYRSITNPEEVKRGMTPEYSDLIWSSKNEQDVFNLHGGLHIFDEKGKIIKESYDPTTGEWILEKINERVQNGHYPIFVTDGNGDKKLHHIRRNRYLSHAYESLSEIRGSLITFGFSFSDNDHHIIAAINAAAKITKNGKQAPGSLRSIYIGVFDEETKKHIESISDKFALKVYTFSSKTANVWK